MMRLLTAFLALLALPLPAGQRPASDPRDFLARAATPEQYVLSRVKDHRIVLLGEAHWIAHDVELVQHLVPQLPAAGVTALGLEVFRESDQARLDALMASPAWDASAAMAVMRTAEFPYREYLEIIHEAWKVSRAGGRLRLVGLGPGSDWRETLLPKGQTYDTFMASIVAKQLAQPGTRIVVYAGLNHAFTRYHQPELPRERRVEAFFDRTGNVLWRQFGEDVFLVVLHHPWRCQVGGKPGRCLPGGPAIECAGAAAGRPAGFDVKDSPFAAARLEGFEYALGYPDLRLEDMADGYVWQKPLAQYRSVSLIPLAEFAPDAAALTQVSAHSPFVDTPGSTREALEKQWQEQGAWLRDAQTTRGWASVAAGCGK